MEKRMDLFAGLGFTIFGLSMFVTSLSFKQVSLGLAIGSEFTPRVISATITILGLALSIQALRSIRKDGQQTDSSAPSKRKIDKRSFFCTLILFGIYVAFMESVGFIIMTFIYLFLQMNILADQARRNLLLFGVISIVTTLLVYYLFRSFFNLMLPEGILG